MAYRAVPTLRWNILNFGRVRSNIQVQDARWEQALQRYRQAVLVSVEEVENALSGNVRSQQAERELTEAEAAAKHEAQVAGEQYRGGVTSFQSLLDAERFLAEIQDRHLEAQGNVALSAVAVYKALGGGWNWQALGATTEVVGEDVAQPAPAQRRARNPARPNSRSEFQAASVVAVASFDGFLRLHAGGLATSAKDRRTACRFGRPPAACRWRAHLSYTPPKDGGETPPRRSRRHLGSRRPPFEAGG